MPAKVSAWRTLLLKIEIITQAAEEVDTAFAKRIITKTQPEK